MSCMQWIGGANPTTQVAVARMQFGVEHILKLSRPSYAVICGAAHCYRANNLTSADVEPELSTGKTYIHDKLDKQGRPVMLVESSKHITGTTGNHLLSNSRSASSAATNVGSGSSERVCTALFTPLPFALVSLHPMASNRKRQELC